MSYDFSGWATRSGIKCSDGKIIMKNAFDAQNGEKVPLVWNHGHNDIDNVIGHAVLESKDGDMYTYCSFNDTEKASVAKELVKHGDITQMSIYANKLVKKGNVIQHGKIREVSLVLAGANPGARIENVYLAHSDDVSEEELIIITGEEMFHSEGGETTVSDDRSVETSLSEEIIHADNKEDEDMANDAKISDKTVQSVLDTLTEEQRIVVLYLLGHAVDAATKRKEDDADMKHNVFDSNNNEEYIAHAEELYDAQDEIFASAKRSSSLKDTIMHAAEDYGIEDINYLFPDAKTIQENPQFVKRDTEWVAEVMKVHRTPFSRVKTVFADITADEARAKGYTKGSKKLEEVFGLLKRETTPTTIYKKQKFDRDDLVDISTFDAVAWVKAEMRVMLNEEIARAILIGDGRSSVSQDKISETNIRPIWSDDDLYSVKVPVTYTSNATDDDKVKADIRAIVKARKLYKGTGTPTFFTTEDWLSTALLLEDANGYRLYKTVAELATAIRAKNIVSVPVMDGAVRKDSQSKNWNLIGILVNMNDYNVGTDRQGEVNFFDDFDIDYNQYKYLLETRMSGALTTPYSALVLETESATASGGSGI